MREMINNGYFAFEKLDAYRHALGAVEFVGAHKGRLRGLPGEITAQLERAVVGALTATCAGAAAEGAERKRIFRGALAEANEAGGAAAEGQALGGLGDA